MQVLLADSLPPQGIQALTQLGLDVRSQPELDAAALPHALAELNPEILVVRSTRVTSEAFAAARSLSLVVRAGAGTNTIDLDAASRTGVFVANCPGKNAVAVAELTLGLILAADRRIPDAVADLRAGRWKKKLYGRARGLYGRTLGLVGFGHIAREVATRARAFGLQVLAYARHIDPEDARRFGVEAVADLHALFERSDIVSVHVPYSQSTKHLVDADAIARLKPGAILIHTARGGVVDDDALRFAVAEGRIRAGLDVFEDEPEGNEAAVALPVLAVDGVYGTPHIGASTDQAQDATAAEVVRIIESYLEDGSVPNVVNVLAPRPARSTLVVRHRDRVGVLAAVLGILREHELNVQQMQNVIFAGNEAASATITLAHRPSDTLLERLAAHEDVLAVDVREVR